MNSSVKTGLVISSMLLGLGTTIGVGVSEYVNKRRIKEMNQNWRDLTNSYRDEQGNILLENADLKHDLEISNEKIRTLNEELNYISNDNAQLKAELELKIKWDKENHKEEA